MVEVFRDAAKGRPHHLLFVTKGGPKETRVMYEIEPCENVIVSFSVTNAEAAARLELGAAPVEERLQAAADLKARGWRLRMRIDPMILHYDHTEVAGRVKALYPERVTLGSLRADPDLRRYVKDGLFSELEPVYVHQLSAHYPFEARVALYHQATDVIGDQCPVALCEEPKPVWEALGLDFVRKPCNCNA
jgi:DNA repair photolyase